MSDGVRVQNTSMVPDAVRVSVAGGYSSLPPNRPLKKPTISAHRFLKKLRMSFQKLSMFFLLGFEVKPLRTLAAAPSAAFIPQYRPLCPVLHGALPSGPLRWRVHKCGMGLILRPVKRYTIRPVYCVRTQPRPGAGWRSVPQHSAAAFPGSGKGAVAQLDLCKGDCREENVSAFQSAPQADPRVPRAHGHARWACSDFGPAAQGPPPPDGVTRQRP